MKTTLLQTKDLILRALEPEDLEFFYTIENDTELWRTSNTTVPYSRYILKQYLESIQGDLFTDKELRLIIESRNTFDVLGMIDIYNFNALHQRAELGIVLLKKHRGKGYAQQAISTLVNYAFEHLMIHQLYAYVNEDNLISSKLFEKCNFKQCGILDDWFSSPYGFKRAYIYQRTNERVD